jgi:hypothetical protein
MIQAEACNPNLQKLKLNANNFISFISKLVNFNIKKNPSNLLQFAV